MQTGISNCDLVKNESESGEKLLMKCLNNEEVAANFAELGNGNRLSVFRFLVKAGHAGASVGEIQKKLDIPASTLSHHLTRMAKVGLIRQEKHSRTIICIPEYAHLKSLIGFLEEECCVGDTPQTTDSQTL